MIPHPRPVHFTSASAHRGSSSSSLRLHLPSRGSIQNGTVAGIARGPAGSPGRPVMTVSGDREEQDVAVETVAAVDKAELLSG